MSPDDIMKFEPHKFEIMSTMYYSLRSRSRGTIGRIAGAATMKLAQGFMDEFDTFLALCRERPEWEIVREMNIEEFLFYFKKVLDRDTAERARNSFWGMKKKKKKNRG